MIKYKIKPYEGNEPYIFISYAHKDSDEVLPIVDNLAARGYRIWYDDGIVPGTEWPQYIAEHLRACSLAIFFVSPNFVKSSNCRNEISFARKYNKNVFSVHIQATEMPEGIELLLSGIQGIYQANYDNENDFLDKICGANGMEQCFGESDGINPPPPRSFWKRSITKLKWKPKLKYCIIALSLLLLTGTVSYLFLRPSQIYSDEVKKAVDTVCAVAVNQVETNGYDLLTVLDKCREYIEGKGDENELSESCELHKNNIDKGKEARLLSEATLSKIEDVKFCKDARMTAEESCSAFKDYIDFLYHIATMTTLDNSQKNKVFNQVEEIVKQKYVIVLDESYGAILPIINDSSDNYYCQTYNYINKTHTSTVLSGMISDSLFGQVYILQYSEESINKINEKINRSLQIIDNCDSKLCSISGNLWSDISKK